MPPGTWRASKLPQAQRRAQPSATSSVVADSELGRDRGFESCFMLRQST
jgi:hypothetical protein